VTVPGQLTISGYHLMGSQSAVSALLGHLTGGFRLRRSVLLMLYRKIDRCRESGDCDKSQAESIAKSIAGAQVVSKQIAVIPPGVESDAKNVNSDLDKGIESNLDAALIRDRLHESVKYVVKNHVVTLTGEVASQSKRARAGGVASAVLNVEQMVNELHVKGQKASSN
jgi:osmotically-inducible protein OsmY